MIEILFGLQNCYVMENFRKKFSSRFLGMNVCNRLGAACDQIHDFYFYVSGVHAEFVALVFLKPVLNVFGKQSTTISMCFCLNIIKFWNSVDIFYWSSSIESFYLGSNFSTIPYPFVCWNFWSIKKSHTFDILNQKYMVIWENLDF